MNKLISVTCLDDKSKLYFCANTPYEAMKMCLYYLNLARTDKSAVINKTKTNKHLWFQHSGKTYATAMGD